MTSAVLVMATSDAFDPRKELGLVVFGAPREPCQSTAESSMAFQSDTDCSGQTEYVPMLERVAMSCDVEVNGGDRRALAKLQNCPFGIRGLLGRATHSMAPIHI